MKVHPKMQVILLARFAFLSPSSTPRGWIGHCLLCPIIPPIMNRAETSRPVRHPTSGEGTCLKKKHRHLVVYSFHQDGEIFWPVIIFDTIDMVDTLTGTQCTPNVLFGDDITSFYISGVLASAMVIRTPYPHIAIANSKPNFVGWRYAPPVMPLMPHSLDKIPASTFTLVHGAILQIRKPHKHGCNDSRAGRREYPVLVGLKCSDLTIIAISP